MEAPNLKLTVEKGPKEGETRECRPNSKIRIGRVIKGNNFTIKDEGISSKHLLIELNHTTSKWVLSDLDSSNGTFLNGVQLDANTEHVLHNGDIIKIGEMTSMKVTIDGQEQELKPKQTKGVKKIAKSGATVSGSTSVVDEAKEAKEVDVDGGVGQLRRNPRRRAAAAAPVVENVPVVVKNPGRRGRPRRGNVEVETEAVEIDAKDETSNIGVGETSQSVELPASEASKVEERVNLKKEICDESCAMPSPSEKSTQPERLTIAKLEKMSLGEWFDYVEVYLVRQIREETDGIIKGMEARAEQFKKFMSEQQKLKNKSPLA